MTPNRTIFKRFLSVAFLQRPGWFRFAAAYLAGTDNASIRHTIF
jgi:hypothetical protein